MPSDISSITSFIARQLNDHETSPHGVAQPTYYTWTEHHITEAVSQALSYVFSLIPDYFATTQCFITPNFGCVVDTKPLGGKVIKLLGVNGDCDNAVEREADTNSLLPLLCASAEDRPSSYERFSYKKVAESVFQFSDPLPAGTTISVLVARNPGVLNMTPEFIDEFKPLLTNFALWWLLLTDNESRTNPVRWDAYYASVREFVQLKLQLQFSLDEDDYRLGQRRTPQSELDK